MNNKNPFDHFDKIVCICGQHEPERWEKVQKEFERIGILDRIERFDEVIDSDWLSETFGETSEWSKTDYCHWKIISDAHENGLKNVFIFESDIHFIDTDLEKMSKSIESLEDVDWKLFYMGGIPHNVYGIVNEHLVNTSMCQAHAYAINGKHCKEVADQLMENKIAIDQVYKRGKRYGLSNASYATNPRFVVQADSEIHTRKNFSTIMWKKVIDPMIDMHRRNIEFITAHSTHRKTDRVMTSNFKIALDNVGIPAASGFVKIYPLNFQSEYEKLELIYGVLKQGKICFYSDPDVVFLKNPLDYLLNELDDYDLIVQSNADDTKRKLKKFKKVLHPGFCLVKPTELTLKLFDTSEQYHFPGEPGQMDKEFLMRWQQHRLDTIYFNTRLNATDEYLENLKIKILDENEFCLSKNYSKDAEAEPYIVHYNEEARRVCQSKTKLNSMRANNHYFVPE